MRNLLEKLIGLFLLGLVIPTCDVQAQIDPVLAAQLQQIIDHHVQSNGDHGISACLIMPDGAVWKGTAGVGQGNVPITDSTVFHGASITKTHVATLLLLLAEDGLVDLDSSWTNYVSLNAGFDTTITIRQLIGHTSGITDYLEVPGTEAYVTTDFNHAFTPVEILETIVSDTPDFAPGTDFSYSSSNYALAAYIVETVTGVPVGEALHSRLWDSLAMTHTHFGGFETYSEPRAGVWWDFGSGLTNFSNDPETSMLTYGYGGANIVSTPWDLARFARALFTDSILSPSSMVAMQTFSPQSYPTWCDGYGLGIHNASNLGNNSVLGHDGYYTNMGDMFHSFDHGFTLVSMTNTQTAWFTIFFQLYNAVKTHLTVGLPELVDAIEVFPQPAREGFTIDFGRPLAGAMVTLMDLSGKEIGTWQVRAAQELKVATADVPSGLYLVRIAGDDFVVVERVVLGE